MPVVPSQPRHKPQRAGVLVLLLLQLRLTFPACPLTAVSPAHPGDLPHLPTSTSPHPLSVSGASAEKEALAHCLTTLACRKSFLCLSSCIALCSILHSAFQCLNDQCLNDAQCIPVIPALLLGCFLLSCQHIIVLPCRYRLNPICTPCQAQDSLQLLQTRSVAMAGTHATSSLSTTSPPQKVERASLGWLRPGAVRSVCSGY